MASPKNRDVNLRIRAKDETAPGVRSAEGALKRLAVAQKRTQARRDLYSGAVQSANELKIASDQAAAASNALGQRMSAMRRPSKQMRDDFAASRDAARQARAAYHDAGVELSKVQGRRGSFVAFDQIASGAKKADVAIDGVSTSLNQMTAAQRRANAVANAGAGRGATRGAQKSQAGALGLRPHEMQNLGYQVNDLVTQIASGTSPMQAFAQQGGQIAQIFPKATSAILRLAPPIAAALLVISPFIVALKQMNGEAKRLDAVKTALATSGNAADYSRSSLIGYAKTLQDLGLKADEVGGVLRTSLREGVRPEYLDRFATAAKGLASVTKDDLADSINSVTEAFTGNADQVLALDDQLGFLTATERKHIEKLRDSKKDAQARTEAFAVFERKYGAIAAKMDGPWGRTLDNFGEGWGALGRQMLSGIQWDTIKSELSSILSLIDQITSRMPGVNQNSRAWLSAEHARIDDRIKAQQRVIASGRGDVPQGSPFLGRGDAHNVVANLERERDDVNRRIAALDRASGRSTPTTDTTTRPPPAANTDKPDRGGASDAERRAEQQQEYLQGLREANVQRAFEITLIGKAEREARILAEIQSERGKAEDAGLTLSAEQAQSIRGSVGALYDAQKVQEASAKIEEWRLQLAQARGEVESRDAYIQRTLAKEMEGADQARLAAGRELLGLLYDQEATKRRQAELEKTVSDKQAVRQELMQQMQAAADVGDTSRVAALREQLDKINAALLIAIRDTLTFLRTQSGSEVEAAILKYAGLEHVMERVGQTAVVTGTQINQMLSQGGANAIDRFMDSLAAGENAFEGLRDAFLSYAADFLRQIAMMIAQQAILNALGGSKGDGGGTGSSLAKIVASLFHTGGVVGSGGALLRSISPMHFAGAMRYHSGGLAGLAPDEVPAILLRNEEVLTEDDPRHRKNGGLGGKGGSVKILNLFDAADALDRGLATEAGEQVFFNFVRRNAGTFKALLG
jgi:hypothetical protein